METNKFNTTKNASIDSLADGKFTVNYTETIECSSEMMELMGGKIPAFSKINGSIEYQRTELYSTFDDAVNRLAELNKLDNTIKIG